MSTRFDMICMCRWKYGGSSPGSCIAVEKIDVGLNILMSGQETFMAIELHNTDERHSYNPHMLNITYEKWNKLESFELARSQRRKR